MFKTVIWATDASEAAEAALPFARELVQESGGTLVVVFSNHADELGLEARIQLQVHELRAGGDRRDLQARQCHCRRPGARDR